MSSRTTNGNDDLDTKVKVEFAVNISTKDDLNKINEALKSKHLEITSSDLNSKTILVELDPKTSSSELSNIQTLQIFIEEQTGILTVVKGLGSLKSAVAELRPSNKATNDGQQVMGVVRVSQLANDHCYFDGLIDGFKLIKTKADRYSLAIHERGDLSDESYETVGNPIVDIDSKAVDESFKTMSVRKTVSDCKLADMIGRSIAVTEHNEDSQFNKRILTAGVIARASTVEVNKKQFCSCSGKTLWEERRDQKSRE